MLEHQIGASVEAAVAERPLLSMAELSSYLGVPRQTLYAWRYLGEGPRSIKVGKHVRYRPEDVERWLDERADRPASEES
jgi:excisionase family DNA binding protein